MNWQEIYDKETSLCATEEIEAFYTVYTDAYVKWLEDKLSHYYGDYIPKCTTCDGTGKVKTVGYFDTCMNCGGKGVTK